MKTPPRKRSTAGTGSTPRIDDVQELMAHAYAMEAEAAERYAEFADAMQAHNNPGVAELFRKLSRIEHLHAEQILEAMHWSAPPPEPSGGYRWRGLGAPESGEHGELHYLMQPYHALLIAQRNEERARRFFNAVMKGTSDPDVRTCAAELEEDEAEHVHLIEQWIARTPAPDPQWERDDDPPMLAD